MQCQITVEANEGQCLGPRRPRKDGKGDSVCLGSCRDRDAPQEQPKEALKRESPFMGPLGATKASGPNPHDLALKHRIK
jgi:hypothetical protein